MTLTTYNFADVWESVVDRVADRVGVELADDFVMPHDRPCDQTWEKQNE